MPTYPNLTGELMRRMKDKYGEVHWWDFNDMATYGSQSVVSGHLNSTYYRQITIDHTKCGSSDLYNFPLLISLNDDTLSMISYGGHVYRNDGYDILFYNSDGVSLLNWEIESYNPILGNLIAWVSIPVISSSIDTIIYISYGSNIVSSYMGGDYGRVWSNDSNYVSVYHLGDGNTISTLDSTVNENTLSINSASASTGKIGGSVDTENGFMYTSSAVNLPSGSSERTISCWFKFISSSVSQEIFAIGDGISVGDRFGIWYGGYGTPNFIGIENNTDNVYINWTPDSNWHNISISLGTGSTLGDCKIYFDGLTQSISGFPIGLINTSGSNISIGTIAGHSGLGTFSGYVDEARISSIERSSDWIYTEFNNQNIPGNIATVSNQFYSVSTEIINEFSREITIDYTQTGLSTLSDFPVLVSIEDITLSNVSFGGNVYRMDGNDIRFYNSDSTTLLNWEIELYNPSIGKLVAWVLIPSIVYSIPSPTITTFYVKYGRPDITSFNGGPTGSVWSGNYQGVWHFGDGTSFNGLDSTTWSNTFINYNAEYVTGKIGGSVLTAGDSSSYVAINPAPSNFPVGSSVRTLSFWFKMNADMMGQIVSYGGVHSELGDRFGFFYNQGLYGGNTIGFESDEAAYIDWVYDTNWHHVSITYAGGTINPDIDFYFDGVLQTVTYFAGDGIILSYLDEFSIGRIPTYTASDFTSVYLDELRVSNIIDTSDWITTEYNNQNNPGNIGSPGFLIYGTESNSVSNPYSTFEYVGGYTSSNYISRYDDTGLSISSGKSPERINTGGRKTLYFDGTDNIVSTINISMTMSRSLYISCNISTSFSTPSNTLFYMTNAPHDYDFGVFINSPTTFQIIENGNTYNQLLNGVISTPFNNIISYRSSNLKKYKQYSNDSLNGKNIIISDTNLYTSSGNAAVWFGALPNNILNYFDRFSACNFAQYILNEVILIGDSVTDEDNNDIMSYLKNKWENANL